MKKRVLITGAGGPSGISFMQALDPKEFDIIMADMDPNAAGLYLSPSVLLPGARETAFISKLLAVVLSERIDILVPTVDAEMEVINASRDLFDDVHLAMASTHVLDTCLDKWQLCNLLKETDLVPLSAIKLENWNIFPALVKPRRSAGARGIKIVHNREELIAAWQDDFVVQEYLPGREFSVDMFVNDVGLVIGCVPRQRLKIDSGIAVAAKTMKYPALEERAKSLVEKANLTGLLNVQLREDKAGLPRLMEVNARNPGTMPLTVKSGINMPKLLVDQILGKGINEALSFKEIAMVRHWTEVYLDVDALKDKDNG
jgi:carbamoyl-phosphate synthase large subunit